MYKNFYAHGLNDISLTIFRSDFLTIATTRPETLFGDVAVAVHPQVLLLRLLSGIDKINDHL